MKTCIIIVSVVRGL